MKCIIFLEKYNLTKCPHKQKSKKAIYQRRNKVDTQHQPKPNKNLSPTSSIAEFSS